VVDYYAAKGLYSPIDANQKFDTVKAAIAAVLSK
jgi:adenylate kinase family enzyme